MSLNVTIPDTFSGPLGLLLYLIRRDELDIMNIPLARLAESYLEEVRKLEFSDIDEGAQFLRYASTLLVMKSEQLLPKDPVEETPGSEDDDDDFMDSRQDIIQTILIYSRFRVAADMLRKMADETASRVARAGSAALPPQPEAPLTPTELADAAKRRMAAFVGAVSALLARKKLAEDVEHENEPQDDSRPLTDREAPIEVRIEQIQTVLNAHAGSTEVTRFSKLLPDNADSTYIISYFLAVLEMLRQGRLTARQTTTYSDIILELPPEPEPAALPVRVSASRCMSPFLPLRKAALPVRRATAPAGLFAQSVRRVRPALRRVRPFLGFCL